MLTQVQALVFSAALTWLMLLGSSLLRARAWTLSGLRFAFGNRENAPEPTGVMGRADRAARNMLENMVLLVAVMLAASLSGHETSQVREGATIFFWSRVVYWPVYLAGVAYLRTAIWSVSIAGLAMIALSALG